MGEKRTGSCHCGRVRFTALLKDCWDQVRRCNCTYCTMRGAVTVSVKQSDFDLTEGSGSLGEHRFHSKSAVHHFCRDCGVHTQHQRRSDPSRFGVNAACIDGISPFDFPEIPVSDGLRHPSDINAPARNAGAILFRAAAPLKA